MSKYHWLDSDDPRIPVGSVVEFDAAVVQLANGARADVVRRIRVYGEERAVLHWHATGDETEHPVALLLEVTP